MSLKHILKISVAVITLAATLPAVAQDVPLAISYQAALTDDADNPLSPTTPTNYPMQFRIYNALEGGTLLWAESQTVSVFNGSFSTLLGTGDAIDGEVRPQIHTIFDDSLRYLEITIIENATPKTFIPRQRMVSTPFAFRADFATTAEVASTVVNSSIHAGSLATNAVTSAKILNGAVSSTKLANNSVNSAKITDSSITSSDIANSTISLDDIATAVSNRLVPAGTIVAWAGLPAARTTGGHSFSNVPTGWILCHGGSYSIHTYPDLYAAIGHIYGGSGSTFHVPDYRGYFLRHQGSTHDPDYSSRTKSSTFATSHGLLEGSIQSDQFKSHNHHNGSYNKMLRTSVSGHHSTPTGFDSGASGSELDILNHAVSSSKGGNETRPKNRYVYYIIKAH